MLFPLPVKSAVTVIGGPPPLVRFPAVSTVDVEQTPQLPPNRMPAIRIVPQPPGWVPGAAWPFEHVAVGLPESQKIRASATLGFKSM